MAGGQNGPPVLNGSPYVYPTKTLADLRDDLLTLLGFPDPLTSPDSATRTRLQIQTRILDVCFPDPLTSLDAETQQLVWLREQVIRRLGHRYSAGSNAPGVDDLTDSFINEAQQTVFRLAELDKAGVAYPAHMTNDSDPTEIDYVPVLAMAIGLAKAHYGQQDAQAYFEEVQKYLKDRADRRPPNVIDVINSTINEAQQSIFRMVEMDKGGVAIPADMTADGDATSIDYVPVLALAMGQVKAKYEQKDAKIYFDQLEKYLRDRALRRPPNIVDMCTKWLQKAQEKLYLKYKLLRTELWWKIPITVGQRLYDVPSISSGGIAAATVFDNTAKTITRSDSGGSWITDGFRVGDRVKGYGADNAGNNDTQWTITALTSTVMTLDAADTLVDETSTGTVYVNTANWKSLDFRYANEAWLYDDGRWLPLYSPFSAGLFNVEHNTIPTHYELREYLELIPTPDKAYTVYLRGHMGLKPFDADTDTTTIDPDLILFQAIAWGKAHFSAKDAMLWQKEWIDMVGDLNAGRFSGKRYIPNPNPVTITDSYPQVTGTGWTR